ncbi:hypothetical protein [Catenuloplanes japonicus]|uniref:hypothetical protein n=1 Tax=Catenuloplanes japonicus TaxID=33876 RepID=UPI000B120F38|nr:hypothetical protein [Catenuloplanes japonicus]
MRVLRSRLNVALFGTAAALFALGASGGGNLPPLTHGEISPDQGPPDLRRAYDTLLRHRSRRPRPD